MHESQGEMSAAARYPCGKSGIIVCLSLCAGVDATSGVGIASLSGGAVTTVVIVVVLIAVLSNSAIYRARARMTDTSDGTVSFLSFKILMIASPFLIWALWGVARTPSLTAFQNLLVFTAFFVSVQLSAFSIGYDTADRRRITLVVEVFALPASIVVLMQSLGLVEMLVGNRAFALMALPALIVNRFSSALNSRFIRGLLGLIYVTSIVASLSRTATLVALLIVIGAQVQRSAFGKFQALVSLALSAYCIDYALTSIDKVKERVFGGDKSIEYFGVRLNSSGRDTIWRALWDRFLFHPWSGQGLGSSSDYLSSNFSNISQPHNDYLRLVYDLGLVGLILWLVPIIFLLRKVWPSENCRRNWSGVCGLICLLIVMVTDNILIYSFAMVPFAVVVGSSFSTREVVSR